MHGSACLLSISEYNYLYGQKWETLLLFLKFGATFQNVFSKFDERYLVKIFCRQNTENDLTRLYEKLAMA